VRTVSEGPEAIGGLPDDERWSEQMHRAALERKGALADCEACGSNAWGVGQRLLLLPALDASGSWVAGRGVDAIPVFCRRCGLLRLHAATILLRD
jgi:hypothetical protein